MVCLCVRACLCVLALACACVRVTVHLIQIARVLTTSFLNK